MALGEKCVVDSFDFKNEDKAVGLEIDVVGRAQRIVIIPEDEPDLAISVVDVDFEDSAVKSAPVVLQRGMQISGKVVSTTGQPLSDRSIYVEITLPEDSRERITDSPDLMGGNVKHSITGDVLTIFYRNRSERTFPVCQSVALRRQGGPE